MSDPKQVRYFDHSILGRDLDWYWKHFDPPEGAQPAPVRGEITPFYARLKEASVRNIRRLLPEARIVLTIRNPVDRCWSHAHLDFGHYGRRRLEDLPPGVFMRYFERARVERYTEYEQVIDRWQRVFGGERLHVALFDQVASEPTTMLRAIFEHLGADPNWEPPLEQVAGRVRPEGADHQGLALPDELRWYLSRKWLEPTKRLNDRLDGRVSHWVEQMRAAAHEDQPGWRARRILKGVIGSLPERFAFAAYDRIMDLRLAARWRRLLTEESPQRMR